MTQRICIVEGCDRETAAPNRAMCGMHKSRLYRTGTTEPSKIECAGCGAEIAREGRGGSSRRKYCTDACRRRTLRPIRPACLGCGGELPDDRRRKYCSRSCVYLAHNHGKGKRPASRPCVACGATVDLTERMADGRLRRPSYTKRCDGCQAQTRPTKYGMTAAQVAERDGTECRWCGEPVDLELIGSRSKWAPSVDHIKPWSMGGTNAPENLQLMHRVCNAKKGVRTA